MCGRFTLFTPGPELAEQFGVTTQAELILAPPRYNIAPTQPVAAIRADQAGQASEWALFRWGLIPSWAKDLAIGSRLINARSETAAEKPSFRAAFKRRRCLIPMDGFYEWVKRNGNKQPHFIHIQDRRPFAVAGLWEFWQDAEGSSLVSCTLLTTSPNEMMAPLHNRMPVIVAPEDYDMWLFEERREQLQHLLRPYPADSMRAYPVSTLVNSPRNDEAACIAPLA